MISARNGHPGAIQRIGWVFDRVREMLWDLGVVGLAGAIALGLSFLSLVETFVATLVGLLTADAPDADGSVEGLLGLFSERNLTLRIGDRIIFLEPLITRLLVFVTILVVVAILVDRAREAELGEETAP